MKDGHDDLERLRGMSAGVDRLLLSRTPGESRAARSHRMIVAGVGMILVCAAMLCFAYQIAGKVAIPSDPASGSSVLEKMFALNDGGWAAIPGLVGLIVGIGLVVLGIRGRKA
jgi:hypothetical protein